MSNEKPSENDRITEIPHLPKGIYLFIFICHERRRSKWIQALITVQALILAMLGSASIPAPETLVLSPTSSSAHSSLSRSLPDPMNHDASIHGIRPKSLGELLAPFTFGFHK
jgi:hypothetical protein